VTCSSPFPARVLGCSFSNAILTQARPLHDPSPSSTDRSTSLKFFLHRLRDLSFLSLSPFTRGAHYTFPRSTSFLFAVRFFDRSTSPFVVPVRKGAWRLFSSDAPVFRVLFPLRGRPPLVQVEVAGGAPVPPSFQVLLMTRKRHPAGPVLLPTNPCPFASFAHYDLKLLCTGDSSFYTPACMTHDHCTCGEMWERYTPYFRKVSTIMIPGRRVGNCN